MKTTNRRNDAWGEDRPRARPLARSAAASEEPGRGNATSVRDARPEGRDAAGGARERRWRIEGGPLAVARRGWARRYRALPRAQPGPERSGGTRPSPAVRRSNPSLDRREEDGFTLIEVLVVIVVITVLATLVAPNVFRHVGSAKEATAKTQIEMLSSAIDAYRLDNDLYPTSQQGLAALRTRPEDAPAPRNWLGPYLRREVPADPWGRPYLYRSPGTANPDGFDLLTLGRDGREGGEGEDADVLGWK